MLSWRREVAVVEELAGRTRQRAPHVAQSPQGRITTPRAQGLKAPGGADADVPRQQPEVCSRRPARAARLDTAATDGPGLPRNPAEVPIHRVAGRRLTRRPR